MAVAVDVADTAVVAVEDLEVGTEMTVETRVDGTKHSSCFHRVLHHYYYPLMKIPCC